MASEGDLTDLPALPQSSPTEATAKPTNVDHVERSGTPSPDSIKNKNSIEREASQANKSSPTNIFDSDEEGLSDPPATPSDEGDDENDKDYDPTAMTKAERKQQKHEAAMVAESRSRAVESGDEEEVEEPTPAKTSSKSKGKSASGKSKSKKGKGKSSSSKSKSKKRKSDIFELDEEEAEVGRADVKKPKRNTAVGLPGNRPLPASYEDCLDYDKMLLDMRDGGMGWEPIRKRWYQLTGEKTGQSTLPNRWSRIKANFIQISDDDSARMIKAKQDIEAAFEVNKWDLISKHMTTLQGNLYKPGVLKRHYQNLMAARDVGPPAGVVDQDFEYNDEEGEGGVEVVGASDGGVGAEGAENAGGFGGVEVAEAAVGGLVGAVVDGAGLDGAADDAGGSAVDGGQEIEGVAMGEKA
ncbi:hypothetical protein MBLNU230_g5154t1 [Neophaeotheca triangularis]